MRVFVILISLLLAGAAGAESFKVLVFSKTVRFRHPSIAEGTALVRDLAATHGFEADFTEDAADFTDANLGQYAAVIFMNTSGGVFNTTQRLAFQRYVRGGGGWAGVHAAAVTETGWTWYQGLAGAIFQNHPSPQTATIRVENRGHPSTAHLSDSWIRYDEWYNYLSNPRAEVTVLMTLDESSYNGGTMGDDHPIAWYHEYEGGRAWYTGLGHTPASYREPAFVQHLLGGIYYAAGTTAGGPTCRVRTVVPAGSVWRYWDRGEDLGTAWSAPGFDDQNWPSGPAMLGSGDGVYATPVEPGPAGDYHRTTYFRQRFELADLPLVTRLTARILRDDGAVVYLNGTEIGRSNMGEGPVTYQTVAAAPVEGGAESAFFAIEATLFAEALRVGENVMAVEVHRSGREDSDLGFDFALEMESVIPPVIEVTRDIGGGVTISWREDYSTRHGAVLERSETLGDWSPLSAEYDVSDGIATCHLGAGECGEEGFFRLRYGLPGSP